MANSIEAAKKYVPVLDAKYTQEATTSVLDTTAEIEYNSKTGEFSVGQREMSGLGTYDPKTGYPAGDVKLTWESHKPDYNRGQGFTVDNMENEDAAGLGFADLAGQFIKEYVAPELDAVRFAQYAAKAGKTKEETIADAAACIAAIRAGQTALTDAEVSAENRYLFITPALADAISDMDTTKSRAIFAEFAGIVKVPSARFVSAITLHAGTAADPKFGFEAASGAAHLNFEIIQKDAVMQFIRHAAPKIVSPEANQKADAFFYGYRIQAVCDVYAKKVNGIYVSKAPVSAG